VTARLHHERLAAPGATPDRWLMITHGIYGSGGNWRSIARKILERRPAWGAVLVDLRGHGRSEQGPPPHTIAACADDVRALIDELAAGGTQVRAIAGHSFGGKVMLAVRAARADLAHTWVLDSTPSRRPGMWEGADNDVREVWEAMRALPRDWPRREDFIGALTSRGFSAQLAQWLAMSLHPITGAAGFRLALDLDAIREMLTSYYETDLWSAVEDPALPGDVHLIVAGRSETVNASDRARLAAEPPERRVHTHIIADAGHWLHIDAPAAVVDRIAAALI
jgi:esterase